MEMVAEFNSPEFLQAVVARSAGTTFWEQAKSHMVTCQTRKYKPVKEVTAVTWQCHLDNHILPVLGDRPLAAVKNAAMKELVEVLSKKKLSAESIRGICLLVKLIVASATDAEGERLYPVKWNTMFIEMPQIKRAEQRTPAFTGEEVTSILAKGAGWFRVLVAIAAASGLRIFRSASGKPLRTSNILRRQLHPVLAELGIEMQGFHGFRRFRDTYLKNRTTCPSGVIKFWLGHSIGDMSEHYDKIRSEKEATFRRKKALEAGYRFTLPATEMSSSVPNVPRIAVGKQADSVVESAVA